MAAEMQFLRSMFEITRPDNIEKDDIRNKMLVENLNAILNKYRETGKKPRTRHD
jgi:hypothetical protein